MKRIILFFTLLTAVFFAACRGNITQEAEHKMNQDVIKNVQKYTTIEWVDSLVNFGTIKMGEKARVHFRFKNTGENPLYLVDVQAGCGCTVVDYTRGAIPPKREGVVTAEFDSNRSDVGDIRKSITVHTNTKGNTTHQLVFTGEVWCCGSGDNVVY